MRPLNYHKENEMCETCDFIRKKYVSWEPFLLNKMVEPEAYAPLMRENLQGQLSVVRRVIQDLDILKTSELAGPTLAKP